MPPRFNAARQPLAVRPVRPELPREFVAAHKRKRIVEATAELMAEQGYEATKIADIVRRAGVARKTLYDNFEGKEEVFLATFDAALEEAMRRIEESCRLVDGGWEDRVEAGLSAFLGYVAEEPALARMCIIEALSATPAAIDRYEAAMHRFVALIAGATPEDDQLPETMEETLVGGIAWIVYQLIRRDETEKAEERLPELLDFILAPYQAAGRSAGERGSSGAGALADSSA